MACDVALVVFARTDAASPILLANEAAAALVGLPVGELVGRDLGAFVGPRQGFETSVAALLESGAFDGVRAQRSIARPDGVPTPVTAWGRRVEFGDRCNAIALFVPVDDVGLLERDPGAPWRRLAAVALGAADVDGVITQVSADITQVLGGTASDWLGESLSSLVHPDDRQGLPDLSVSGKAADALDDVRFRHLDGSWVTVCALVAPDVDEQRRGMLFALVGPPAHVPAAAERSRELEGRLRRIGLEVRAAGVLEDLVLLPTPGELSGLDRLTTRQREILRRLHQGDRVSTIAADLYVSPSTVRNHLAAIFRHFDVHSQAELLAMLRRQPFEKPRA
jgi:DNA-binding CsgD family transcriptional regulator/PAS domain-containing protein